MIAEREYVITYRQRLGPAELRYVRGLDPLSIEEVTPEGWTRRIYDREAGHGLAEADQ